MSGRSTQGLRYRRWCRVDGSVRPGGSGGGSGGFCGEPVRGPILGDVLAAVQDKDAGWIHAPQPRARGGAPGVGGPAPWTSHRKPITVVAPIRCLDGPPRGRVYRSTTSARRQPWRASAGSRTSSVTFEVTSKRRRGYPSETHVKRGHRVVHGHKELLLEKLGRNDLCPCNSGRRFQEMLHEVRQIRRREPERLLQRLTSTSGGGHSVPPPDSRFPRGHHRPAVAPDAF